MKYNYAVYLSMSLTFYNFCLCSDSIIISLYILHGLFMNYADRMICYQGILMSMFFVLDLDYKIWLQNARTGQLDKLVHWNICLYVLHSTKAYLVTSMLNAIIECDLCWFVSHAMAHQSSCHRQKSLPAPPIIYSMKYVCAFILTKCAQLSVHSTFNLITNDKRGKSTLNNIIFGFLRQIKNLSKSNINYLFGKPLIALLQAINAKSLEALTWQCKYVIICIQK